MAAGGYGRGSGVPLNQRRRTGEPRVDPAGARVTEPVPAAPAAPPATGPVLDQSRHCWVAAPVDTTRPRPGLLLEWRKVERGRFEGRVVYQAELRPGRFALVEEWVPAELLTPTDP
jgi:hypothetical protein